jgi:beta-lactamase class A
MDRRDFLTFTLAAGLTACAPRARATRPRVPSARWTELEGGGRLGVAVLDTATGQVDGHRLDERFAMCSTFKLPLAAWVLERAAAGGLDADAPLPLGPGDLLNHAPVTGPMVEAAVAAGLPHATISAKDAARAAQTTSDNPAANLLLRQLGGPAAFTAYCRGHGDTTTRLDRYEPEMNEYQAGDPRDTTTPRAMAGLLARLFGPDGLPADARATLRDWMIETQTGSKRLRAGLPPTWIAGDKTGTGMGEGQTTKLNDVAWVEPPGRAPLVVAAYFDVGIATDDMRDQDLAVLAAVGRLVAAEWGVA